MAIVIGLDIGGSSLKLGAWDGAVRLAWRQGIRVPGSTDPQEVAAEVSFAVQSFMRKLEQAPSALGIGSCGLISGGVIQQSPNTAWDELPLVALLEARLRLPVQLLNDADAFLYGAWHESGISASVVVGLTLGTGLGTAVLLDGRLLRGGSGISPEAGHVTLDVHGEPANTGIPGSWESLACRSALLSYYMEAGGTRLEDPLAVAHSAERGEKAALSAWAKYGRYLGAGLGSLCNVFSPQLVIIGGGLAGSHRLFAEPLKQALDLHMLAAMPRPQLRFVDDRPDAVAFGAALYAQAALAQSSAGRSTDESDD